MEERMRNKLEGARRKGGGKTRAAGALEAASLKTRCLLATRRHVLRKKSSRYLRWRHRDSGEAPPLECFGGSLIATALGPATRSRPAPEMFLFARHCRFSQA
ncbi:hypothetical protein MRX96_010639 [Rhipicephalus microplus]